MKIFVWFAIAVTLIAATIGSLSASTKSTLATVYYTLDIHGGGNSTLTCGWHSTCLAHADGTFDTSGPALDWANGAYGAYETVYWRSWGMVQDASGLGVGSFHSSDTSTCYRISVDISSPSYMTYRGTEHYLHSETATTSSFAIDGSFYGSYTSYGIGWTAADEKSVNCPRGGATASHLHQSAYGESGTWTQKVSGSASSPYPVANTMHSTQAFPNFTQVGERQDRGEWTD